MNYYSRLNYPRSEQLDIHLLFQSHAAVSESTGGKKRTNGCNIN